jgi:hypothetical protein
MKVKEGSMYCKIYDGCYTKQWIRILKAIWTSPILKRRFTCQTSFIKTFLTKDCVNDEVPSGTLNILGWTSKPTKVWFFYILGSCGVHFKNISSILERTHLSYTMLINDDHVFPFWYVEYLSSLWMSFKW